MRFHAALAAAAGLLLGAETPPAPEVSGELARLRGEWYLVSTADTRSNDAGSDRIRMTIAEDGRVAFKFGDVTTNRGVLTLSRSGPERWLDLRLASGKTVLGVYERFGDDLVICWDHAGKPRPVGLQPAGTQWTERWRRTSP
jgi:uncharacterized protein (TIGR03067 family)